MKRGLGWLQTIIGLIFILKYIIVITTLNINGYGSGQIGYALGSNIDSLLIGLFALFTGISTLKKNK